MPDHPDDLDFHVVDVFTTEAFAGNPLAVVLGADELRTAALQAVANEFNLSETAFPMAADDGADYRLRIFTPSTELPFAGHPSVGAAWVLRRLGRIPAGPVVQSCGAGRLALDVHEDGVALTGGTPTDEGVEPVGPLLRAVGLEAKDAIGVEPRTCGTGLPWSYLLVRDEALARCAPDPAAVRALGDRTAGVAVLSWDGETAHARVFAGGVGVDEDPATGSAALGLGVFLVASGLLPEGGGYRVEQGREIGRPSLLEGSVSATAGQAVSATVRGSVVPVATGRIRRP